jgi:hypothetical protein
MTVRINDAARTARVAATAALVDGGAGAGHLRVYSGSQPAGPGSAPTGTLLLDFTLNDPAFAAGAAGVQSLDVSPALEEEGLAAGTAGWARLLTSTEAAGSGLGVIDCAIADLTISTTTISVGLPVSITSLALSDPAS